MPRSVERWLETFMCKQYAEIFEAFGVKTLHSVCQLQIQQLQSMRIPPEHCELIMQNVQILRQSMSGGLMQQQSQYGEEMGPYNNRMAHSGGIQGMGYQGRDMPAQQVGQMNMNPGNYGSHMGGNGDYGNQRSAMISQQQQQQYSNQAMYHQQMRQQQQQQQQQYMGSASHHQYQGNTSHMGMTSHSQNQGAPYGDSEVSYSQKGNMSPGKAMYRQQYPGKIPGSVGPGQANSMQQSHPHLRNSGQNPQEVANNILQMASSSYPPSHTVQVPLSKNRSAPYHIPPRSPQYGSQDGQPQMQQNAMTSTTGPGQGQFVYPNTSPHHLQQQQPLQHTRMSPVSPGSGVMGMLPSPHSHHSGHSISSSSPCSLHSPGARDIQSPVSDLNTPIRRTPSNMIPNSQQQMASPQRGQYHITSPSSTPHHQRMVSPGPVSQQHPMSDHYSVSPQQQQQQQQQQMYRDNMSGFSGPGSHSHVQPMSQYTTGSQQSPGGQSSHSVSSGHSGNVPSPYNPKSSSGYSPSQNQSYSKQQPPPSPYVETSGQQTHDTNQPTKNNLTANPLQSLQKLCMLPERQVVDPKSVVNDACAPSPQSNEYSKNLHMNADSQGSDFGVEGRLRESASSYTDSKCADGREDTTTTTGNFSASTNCASTDSNEPNIIEQPVSLSSQSTDVISNKAVEDQTEDRSERDDISGQSGASGTHEVDEVRCQPKKMMLLRATKEEFKNASQQIQLEPQVKANIETVSEEETNHENSDQRDIIQTKKVDQDSDFAPQECSEDNEFDNKNVECYEQDFDENNSDIHEIRIHENDINESFPTNQNNLEEGSDEKSVDVTQSEKENQNDEESICEDLDKKSPNGSEEVGTEIKTSNGIDQLENCDEQEKCEEGTFDSKSIQTKAAGIQSSAAHVGGVTEISDSDTESQLVVRKDIKSTYSKIDRMKSIENALRSRGLSTGSLSDDGESEMEFEDHIGCDDIENDFSYSDEKEDIIEIDENEEPEMLYEVNVKESAVSNINRLNGVKDKVVISSPHWKKSRLNDLQGAGANPCSTQTRNGTVTGVRKVATRKRASHVNGIKSVDDVIEIDCDDDIPSPSGANIIGGLSFDNSDGTMSVAGATRVTHRQRKTPIKFKDTSFFQGDFIFEEEEEEEDELYIPKKKCAKKYNSTDMNHNMKRNEDVKKKKICENKGKVTKKDSVKDKKVKHNTSAKSKHLKSKDGDGEGDEVDLNEGEVNGEVCEMSELAVGTRKTKSERGGSTERTKKPIRQTSKAGSNHDKGVSAVKNDKSKRSVRSSSRNDSVGSDIPAKAHDSAKPKTQTVSKPRESPRLKGNMPKSDAKDKVFNGNVSPVRKQSCESDLDKSKTMRPLNGIRNTDDQPCQTELDDDTKDGIDDLIRERQVIKIEDSEDSVDAVVSKSSLKESGVIKTEIKSESVVHDSDAKGIEKIIKVKSEGEQGKEEVNDSSLKKLRGKRGPDLKKRKPRNQVASDEPKSSSCKKKSASKRKRNKYHDDLDYEFGSDKKSMKSLNLNRTHDLLSSQKKKERKDKWVDFKGPVIRLEGAKENPEKCIVINDPFDHSDSKKKKVSTQTVTSIHISHMPPDKSILIPHNEAEEGNQWVCALCGKHSSYKFLGDLFGPYTIENMAEDMCELNTHFVRQQDSKRRKSDSSQPGSSKSSRSGKRVSSVSKEAEMFKEVWVHEACAVWSDGVFLIADKIYGLQEAVRIASQTPCSHCLEMGAMIGCLNKGCQLKYHTSCAMERECFLDEENFSLLCPKHKVRKLKLLEMAAGGSGTVT